MKLDGTFQQNIQLKNKFFKSWVLDVQVTDGFGIAFCLIIRLNGNVKGKQIHTSQPIVAFT